MAKRKVVWSETAKIHFQEIISFYIKRNGNSRYSKFLSIQIKRSISNLTLNNYLGKNSSFSGIRVLVHEYYEIFYKLTDKEIVIELIWDSRRNPDDLNPQSEI